MIINRGGVAGLFLFSTVFFYAQDLFAAPAIGDKGQRSATSSSKTSYKLSIQAKNGSVTRTPKQRRYSAGAQVLLTAVPEEGYEFEFWNRDVISTTNPIRVTMDSNKKIVANFRQLNDPPQINAGRDRSISLPSSLTLRATASDDGRPDGHLSFAWSMVAGPGRVTFSQSNSLETHAIFSDPGNYRLRITAFDGLSSSDDEIAVVVHARDSEDPAENSAVAGRSGQASGPETLDGDVDASEAVYGGGSDSKTLFPRDSNAGSVMGFGVTSSSSSAAIMIQGGRPSETASFGRTQKIMISAFHGTVTKDPDRNVYPTGNQVELTARPDSGYEFDFWEGDVTGTANPVVVIMDGDKSVSAHFKATNQAPKVEVGADRVIGFAESVMLEGRVSDDGLPSGTLDTAWALVSGPAEVVLADPMALMTAASFSARGAYVLRLTASDGVLFTTDELQVTVNDSPVFSKIGSQSVAEGEVLQLALEAVDADGDALIFSAKNLPVGAEVDSQANIFRWKPDFDQAGDHEIMFSVWDAVTDPVMQSVMVRVSNTNRSPVAAAGQDQKAPGGSTVTLDGSGTKDPDGDALVYTWSQTSGPGVRLFNATTIQPTFTAPLVGDSQVLGFRLEVTDEGGLSSADTIEVNVFNSPPVLEPIKRQTVAEGQILTLAVKASDAENDALIFSAQGLPPGADFDAVHGRFEWEPSHDQAGIYAIFFTVADPFHEPVLQEVSIEVTNVNRAPTVVSGLSAITDEDQALLLVLEASDPDGDDLTYEIVAQPSHGSLTMEVDPSKRVYTPTVNFNGGDAFVFRVKDSQGLNSDNATVTLRVVPVNDAPVFESIGDRTVVAGNSLSFTLKANDVDGDPLLYSAQNLPEGASLDPSTHVFYWKPGADQLGDYQIVFTVSDSVADPVMQNVGIRVSQSNQPPVAAAGPDQATTSRVSVILDGSGSQDPEGEALTFAWTQSAGPPVTLFNAKTVRATFTAPMVGDSQSLRFVLQVKDPSGAASEDACDVVVSNTPPVFNWVGDQTVAEGQELRLTVRASDVENDPLTLSAQGLPEGANFNSSTGYFNWTPSFDQAGSYAVSFWVSDPFNEPVRQEIRIEVKDVNQAPKVNAGQDQVVTLPSSVTLSGTVSDDGLPSNTLTSTWSKVSGVGTVTFANANALNTTASLSEKGVYVLRLTASDGALSSSDDVSVEMVQPLQSFTLTLSATNGSITKTPDQSTYSQGSTVTLTATPNTGYQFSSWSGSISGSTNPITVTMDANKTITANFTQKVISDPPPQTWTPPIGIPRPPFGIEESYRMYDDPAKRNPALTYTQNAEGGFYTHYVDSTSSSCVSSGTGTAAAPLCNFPDRVWSLPAGAVVEIHGGPYAPGRHFWTMNGTPEMPVFVRGFDRNTKVQITGQETTYPQGQYGIVENIEFYHGRPVRLAKNAGDSRSIPSHHMALRNIEVHNPPGFTEATGSNVILGGAYMVLFDSKVHDNVRYINGLPADSHGVHSAQGGRYHWILDSEFYGNSGDGFQACHQCYTDPPQYIFIGRNKYHHDAENGVDLKFVRDIVVSENKFYDYSHQSDTGTVSPVVIGSDGASERVWFIFNEFSDSRFGIRVEEGIDVHLVGNIFRDLSGPAINLEKRGQPLYMIGNIFHRVAEGVNQTWRVDFDLTIENNIFSNIAGYVMRIGSSSVRDQAVLNRNLFWNESGSTQLIWGRVPVTINSDATANALAGTAKTGNMFADPLFVDAQANDFHLQPSSPVIDRGMASDINGKYLAVFGESIARDFAGIARPQGDGWDIGAFEYVSGDPKEPGTFTLTVSASNGSVTKSLERPSYDPGTQVTLTAVPNTDYVFSSWSGDLEGTQSPATVTLSRNLTVTANFAKKNKAPIVSAGADQVVTLPLLATLSGTATDDGLPSDTLTVTWSQLSGPGTATFTNPNALTTTASFSEKGFYLLRMTVSDGALSSSDEASVEAVQPLPSFTLTVNATNGSVSKTPNQSSYSQGSTVTLTATPNTGYQFSSWSGSISSSTNPITVIMDANKSVTANFNISTPPDKNQPQDYVGIPRLDMLLTNDPDGKGQDWQANPYPWPRDPRTEPTPAWPAGWPSEAVANHWYIDNTHPNATDANMGDNAVSGVVYGTPNRPRLTLMGRTSFDAGAYIEIQGGPYNSGTSLWKFNCAESKPCWVTSDPNDKAVIAGSTRFGLEGSRWLYLENLMFDPEAPGAAVNTSNNAISMSWDGTAGQDTHHVVIRHVDFKHWHYISGGGGMISVGSDNRNGGLQTHSILIYDVSATECGNTFARGCDWMAKDCDNHLVHIGARVNNGATTNRTHHVWVLDSDSDRISGNQVQAVSIGVPNIDWRELVHHVYLGGNTHRDSRQSGWWAKRSSNFVVSSSHSWGNRQWVGGNGQASGMQYGPNWVWFINNDFHDSDFGVQQTSTNVEADPANNGKLFVLGNRFYDIRRKSIPDKTDAWRGGFAVSGWSNNMIHYIAFNTCVSCESGLATKVHGLNRAEDGAYVWNNIMHSVDDTVGTMLAYTPNGYAWAHNNVLWDGANFKVRWGRLYTSLSSWTDAGGGNVYSNLNVDPLLANTVVSYPERDYSLLSGSPAAEAGALAAADGTDPFKLFQSRYGVDISRDVVNSVRLAPYSSGAYESTGSDPREPGTFTLSVTASNGSVTKSLEGPYDPGTQVTLVATPDSGYVFSSWSGSISGSTNPITVTMDANKSVTANFVQTNKAPIAYPGVTRNTMEDQALSVTLEASDPDGDGLTYEIVTNPSNGSLGADSDLSKRVYTPKANFNGSDTFSFKVKDSKQVDSNVATVTLSVKPVADAPVFAPIGNRAVASGSLLSFSVSASDADNDPLTFSVQGLPQGASFNPATKTFSWTPNVDQVGEHPVVFKVSDGITNPVEQAITVTVTQGGLEPEDRTPHLTVDSKKFDPTPGQRVGVPDPGVMNEHTVPGYSGPEWQSNPDPWEPGAVINGSAELAVAPSRPSAWPGAPAVDHYYVDPGHAACTDLSNVYGYPNKPRCSPPTANLLAGSRIELASTNGPLGVYKNRYGPRSLSGTREKPIWFVGNQENPPFFSGSWDLGNPSWVYVENITWGWQDGTTDSRPACVTIGGAQIDHVVVRDSRCQNRHFRNKNLSGYLFPGGAGFGISPAKVGGKASYVHFHNNVFKSVGNPTYDATVQGNTFYVANDSAHGFVNGVSVQIEAEPKGRVPAPLVASTGKNDATLYTVINVNAEKTSFQLAVEGGSVPIPLEDEGVGVFQIREVAPSSFGLVDNDYHSMSLDGFGKDRSSGVRAHHIWFTDNKCLLGAGDCIQITGQNFQGTTNPDDAREVFHHLWINGNQCTKQRQACFGSKIASHLVISENLSLYSSGGNGSFNMQYSPTYTWMISNVSYATSGFSRNSTNNMDPTVSSSALMHNYWLNNLAVEALVEPGLDFNGMPMSGGFVMAQKPQLESGSRRYIGWNTCIDCYSFFTNPGVSSAENVETHVYKNAFISPSTQTQNFLPRLQESFYVAELGSGQVESKFNCNLIDARRPFRALSGNMVITSLSEWQAKSATQEDIQSLYADPMLQRESYNLNLLSAAPSSGSPLIDPAGEACADAKFPDGHDPWAKFYELYGIDIFKDHQGNSRQSGSASDIGAFEYTGSDPKEPGTFTLNVMTSNGSVTKSPDQPSYNAGDQVTLTALPDADYEFSYWSGDLSSAESSVTVKLDRNLSVSARFVKKNKTPIVSAGADQVVTLPLLATLSGTATDDGLPSDTLTVTWSQLSGPGTATFTNPNALTTTASFSEKGFYLLRMTVSDGALSSSDEASVEAVQPLPSFTLTVNATNGSVSKTPNQSSYSQGSSVTLTATPNTGYQFSSWSGSISGSANPITVTMDANKSVTANFTIDSPPPVDGNAIFVDSQLVSNCSGNYSIANRNCTGTDGDALRTPQGVSDLTSPGSTVYFRGGIYDSESMAYYPVGGNVYARLLEIKKSGIPDARITYKNYNNEPVILKGYGYEDRDLDRDINGYADGPSKGTREELIRVTADYVTVSGITVTNSAYLGATVLGNFNTVENCLFKDNWMIGLYVTGSNNLVQNNEGYGQRHGNAMSLSAPQAGDGSLTGMSNNNIFRNNLLHDNGYDPATNDTVLPILGDPAGGGNSDGSGASKVCADNAAALGVENACLGNQWIDNIFYHNADDGLDISTSETMVKGNIAFNNGPEGSKGYKILRPVPKTNYYYENIALGNITQGFDLRSGDTLKYYHNMALRHSVHGATGMTIALNNVEAFNGNNGVIGNDVGTNDPAQVMFANNNFDLTTLNVNIPDGLTIPERIDFVRNQFKAALALQAGSPLIDKGQFVEGYHCARADDDVANPYPADDDTCRHWNGTAPDIGAFEYGLGDPRKPGTFTLSVSVSNGSVSKTPDQSNYSQGSSVTLTATPNTGYQFSSWSGSISSSTNPITVTMDANKTITANFTQKVISNPPSSELYLGVPDPAGRVPAAIMPILPSPDNTIQAFPYDPINIPTPTYTGAANQYWVDGSHSACNDAGNGTPSAPRCNLPGISGYTWTLAAGSQVFVAGDGHLYGGGNDVGLKFYGTADNPIWIIGVVARPSTPRWASQPKLNFAKFRVADTGNMTHTFFHNVHFYSATDQFRFGIDKSASPKSSGVAEYITIRHSTCSGSGTFDGQGTISTQSVRCFSTVGSAENPVRFFLLYDNDIFGLGRWVDDYSPAADLHGFQPQRATYYVWYLKNRSYHLQGDSIQCSNSQQWNLEHAVHPHYIYIAGNEFYENYENAYDAKGCYHVVFSENYVHDFYNKMSGANATPIIAAQDVESTIGDRYGWFLNNRLENVGDAFSYKGTADDAFVYFMGNLAVNINEGQAVPIESRCTELLTGWTCGDGMFLAQNTIDCGQKVSGVVALRNSDFAAAGENQVQNVSVVGNIFLGCLNQKRTYAHGFGDIWNVTYNHNVDYRADGGDMMLPPSIDASVGNLTNVDPKIANPTNTLSGDYSLRADSPALKKVPEPEPYTLFKNFYGLDIRKDLNGKTWKEGEDLNVGAYQSTPQGVILSVSASNGSVTKSPDQFSYSQGSSVMLTATPLEGYQFSSWGGSLSGSTNPMTVTLNSNLSVVANFIRVNQAPTVNAGQDQVVTLPSSVTLSGTVSDDGLPSNTLSSTWSKVSGVGTVTFANANALNTTASLSEKGVYVLRLTVSDGALSSSDDVSVEMVQPLQSFTLTLSATNGSITKTPDQSTYSQGSTVTLTAAPNTGYQFSSWSGSISGSTNPITVTMDANKTITANFTQKVVLNPPPQTWTPPIGIPTPSFGIEESNRMYDDPTKRNSSLTYTQNAEGGFYTHYVDNSVACTDTSNLYGTAAKPRCSFVSAMPEGSVVEIHGGPYTSGSQLIMTFSCTEAKPCWFRGPSVDEKPVIRRETIVKGSYVILEHLHYDNVVNAPLGLRAHNSSSLHHAAVRHSELAKVSISGHSAYVFNNIVVYNNNIHLNNFTNLGPDSPEFPENDTHGVGVGAYSQYVWIVDNDIHDVAGDAVGNAHDAKYTTKDYYVGRNKLHDTGENAVDFKEIENVVISQNKMYNNYGPSTGSDGTALVLHYGPTYSPRNAWILFNEIYDSSSTGIQIGGAVTDPVYVIGNIVRDITNAQGTAYGFISWGSRDLHLVGNVFYGNDSGIDITGNGSNSTLYLHNNIIGNNVNPQGLHLGLDDSSYRNVADLRNNLFYQNGGQAKFGWGSVINLSQLKALGKCTTCLEADPLFVNPQGNDFYLQAASPAIDKGLASILYDQYLASFGISIAQDFTGASRPLGSAWDIGAFEYGASDPRGSGGFSLAITTSNGSVTKSPDQSSYDRGSSATLTARPDQGYLFGYWSGDINSSTNPVAVTFDRNLSITAHFARMNQAPIVNAGSDQVVTMPSSVTLSGSATDDGMTAGTLISTWSKFSGPGTVTFANANALSTTAAFSEPGVYVLRLTASDGFLSATDDVSITMVQVTPLNDYTLTITASNGTVTKSPDQAMYSSGTQVVLNAAPNTGYQFSSWSGSISSSTNPITVTMGANKTITANFTAIGSFPESNIYLGVPDPAGQVPRAIMPELPVAGDTIPAFPYDPINLATPEYTGAANQYWVENRAGCVTTGNGTPSVPRCALPGVSGLTWTLAAGSQVFIVGDGKSYGGAQNIDTMKFTGTADQPIWIIGVVSSPSTPRWLNQPKINFERLNVGPTGSLTHSFFHNVHFYSPTDKFRWAVDKGDPSSTGAAGYITVRHSTCSGSGTFDGQGTIGSQSIRCFSSIGRVGNEVKFIVLYDNDFFGMGRWVDDYTTSVDLQGVQIQRATYYTWVLANRIYHMQGDSIMCSNSNQFNLDPALRPHYLYIAGNELYENYENAYDSKGCYHVVVSENYIHDFYNAVKPANASAIIGAQDAESYIGNHYEWILNNKLENVGDAFSYKGTAADAFVYYMGNLAVNINQGAAVPIDARCNSLNNGTYWSCGDGMYFAQNTVDCGQKVSAVVAPRNGKIDTSLVPSEEQSQEISFVGNIFLGCLDNSNASPYKFESINDNWIVTHNYNVDYRAFGTPIVYQRAPLMDVVIGNLTNIDPKIVNPTNTLSGDYSLRADSPALKKVPEPEPYTLFKNFYGLDIRKDLNGKTWQEGSDLNAGAYQ